MHALRALPLLAFATLICSADRTTLARHQQQRQPQPRLVESIEVRGIRRHRGEELLKQIKTRPGDLFDEAQVIRDLQTLIGLGHFDRRSSRVVFELGQRGGVEVSFELQELPVIESVKFEGLRRADERALLEGLRLRRLEVDGGSVYEPDKITRAVGAMKEMLRRRGWRRVEVLTRTDQNTATTVGLTFVVSGLPPQNPPPKRLDRFRRPDSIA